MPLSIPVIYGSVRTDRVGIRAAGICSSKSRHVVIP
jgi:hypothetical protein